MVYSDCGTLTGDWACENEELIGFNSHFPYYHLFPISELGFHNCYNNYPFYPLWLNFCLSIHWGFTFKLNMSFQISDSKDLLFPVLLQFNKNHPMSPGGGGEKEIIQLFWGIIWVMHGAILFDGLEETTISTTLQKFGRCQENGLDVTFSRVRRASWVPVLRS